MRLKIKRTPKSFQNPVEDGERCGETGNPTRPGFDVTNAPMGQFSAAGKVGGNVGQFSQSVRPVQPLVMGC